MPGSKDRRRAFAGVAQQDDLNAAGAARARRDAALLQRSNQVLGGEPVLRIGVRRRDADAAI